MCTNKPFWELVAKLIQNPSETLLGLLLFVVVFLATGLWGESKSWGGDVPTTDMEPSGPILVNCYIAIILIPAPPFPPSTQCLLGGDTCSFPFPISHSYRFVPTQCHFHIQTSPVSVPVNWGPLITALDSSTSLPPPFTRLSDSHFHALSATKIYSNIALSCFQAAVSATTAHGAFVLPRELSPCLKPHM